MPSTSREQSKVLSQNNCNPANSTTVPTKNAETNGNELDSHIEDSNESDSHTENSVESESHTENSDESSSNTENSDERDRMDDSSDTEPSVATDSTEDNDSDENSEEDQDDSMSDAHERPHTPNDVDSDGNEILYDSEDDKDNENDGEDTTCDQNFTRSIHGEEKKMDFPSDDSDDDSDSDADKVSEQDIQLFTSQSGAATLPMVIRISDVTPLEELVTTLATSMRLDTTQEGILMMLRHANSRAKHGSLPTTKNALWRAICRDDSTNTRHLFCRHCEVYLGDQSEPTEQCHCKQCGPGQKNETLSWFIQLSLHSQLEELLATPGIADSLKYRFTRLKKDIGAVEDIYDGKEYQKKCVPGGILNDPNNYSFTFSTGKCYFRNSSSQRACLILLQINELPPHMRKQNMLLAAIYVDQFPSFESIFQRTALELRRLYEDGITWKPDGKNSITSRFVPVVCSVNSVTRSRLLKMRGFNREFGCTFCYADGHIRPKSVRTRVYPVDEEIKSRTDAEMRAHMKQASTTSERLFGIYGSSLLIDIPEFDLGRGVIVESMDSIFLGVAKQQTELMLMGRKTKPWYAGTPAKIAIVNTRLIHIKPPSKISSKPRNIYSMKQWKASEWKNWLLFYCLPCLDGVVPKPYHDLLALLSRAAYILNKDSIPLRELQEVRLLLAEYIKNFQTLFLIENMSFNVHLLNHLVDTVENWGPLWAHNAFPFASFNERNIRYVSSANPSPIQIVTRFFMNKLIDSVLYNPDSAIGLKGRKYLHWVVPGRRERKYKILAAATTSSHILKQEEVRSPYEWEIDALGTAGYHCQHLQVIKRARINGNEYRCRGQNETRRFSNKIIQYNHSAFGEIVEIVQFEFNAQQIYGIFVERFEFVQYAFQAQHIHNVEFTRKNEFVTIDSINGPALMIETTNGLYAIGLPNPWECD